MRFRADGLKSRRLRLGLSTDDYGRLVGASGPMVYLREAGISWLGRELVAKLIAIRKLGKRREAEKRPEMMGAGPAGKRRVAYPETADEFIKGLVKTRKATTSGEINAAWRKSGRPGNADNTQTRLAAGRKPTRTGLVGQRRNRITVARLI